MPSAGLAITAYRELRRQRPRSSWTMSTRAERRPWDLLPSTIAILQLLSHRLPVTTCSSTHQPNGQREWRERVLGDCGFERT